MSEEKKSDQTSEINKNKSCEKIQDNPNENVCSNKNNSTEEIVDLNKLHENTNQNINEIQQNQDQIKYGNINDQGKYLNPDYYDEFGRPKYEDVVNYENQLRAEIELNSPLVSEKLDVQYLLNEFKDTNFFNSVLEITQKYKFIRTVRRDGNCFYRSFMFRLFEQLSQEKNSKLYNDVLKVVEESKNLCERNDYQWMVFEDFYNMFISEWKFIYQLDPLNTSEYMYSNLI